MKNIRIYTPAKYSNAGIYERAGEHIYKTSDGNGEYVYVTSLSFEQEPELNEGSSSENISQYPLEDIMDRFNVSISDYYEKENSAGKETCCLEFSSSAFKMTDAGSAESAGKDMEGLLSLIGKHVYNKTDGRSVKLAIE